MEFSDEEGEILPDYVTDYEFVDGRDQPISFSFLPLSCSSQLMERIYLHGTTIDGLEQIYKQVLAWKYNLSSPKAEVFVLIKGNHWIQLLKPRKRFEVIVRSILITVQFLHFVKNYPQAPAPLIWNHLSKDFSSYDVQPCEGDIFDHIGLVKDAFNSDMNLPHSEYLCQLVGEQPRKRKLVVNNTVDREPVMKPRFVLDEAGKINSRNLLEEEDPEEEEEDPEEEVEDLSPLVSLNGKEKLKGVEDLDFPDDIPQEEEELGEEDDQGQEEYKHNEEELQLFDTCCAFCDNGGDILCCEGPCMRSFHPTLASGENLCRSLGLSQARVDGMPIFFCKNCVHKKHQCSVCGNLGSSDTNSAAEVFRCVSATCGHFYHAHCVAKALSPRNISEAKNIEARVGGGDAFTCPAHKCVVCGRGEDRNLHALQFAICRRCPKAYHRKCLPRGISFQSDDGSVPQRAWDDLLPKRILIYCLDHEIRPNLGTPARNHIVFPGTYMGKEKQVTEKLKVRSLNWISENKGEHINKSIRLESSPGRKLSQISRTTGEVSGTLKIRKDVRVVSSIRNVRKDVAKPGFNNLGSSNIYSSNGKIQNNKACHSDKTTIMAKPVKVRNSHGEDIQESEIERSINSLIEEVDSSFSINDVKSRQRTEYGYTGSRETVDKSITMGKVEATVKAVHTALEKLKSGGCSVEDAMDICAPEMLDQLAQWKQKFQVYLGPFLHGKRYTSYGRHFTKPEKLQEIVDMLHRYVQDGDTIVDFSCGSNDFSCLMSKKLDSVGKSCFFKNYDLHHTKNDFNFEKRNWFSVQKEELPDGSRLIIGLNPPFGVHAKLANKFINKALQFKPKLLILIVPRETHRLDQKPFPYDLIWEDEHLLAGKSFYLPGSIDVNNKQLEQWNLVSPPLYLWSRPDWTHKHREIDRNVQQPAMSNYLMEERHDCYGDFSGIRNQHADLFSVLDGVPEDVDAYL